MLMNLQLKVNESMYIEQLLHLFIQLLHLCIYSSFYTSVISIFLYKLALKIICHESMYTESTCNESMYIANLLILNEYINEYQ